MEKRRQEIQAQRTAPLAELGSRLRALREGNDEAAERTLKEAAEALFEAAPELEAIRWLHFTPAFDEERVPANVVCPPSFLVSGSWFGEDADRFSESPEEYGSAHVPAGLEPFVALLERLHEPLGRRYGTDTQLTLTRDGTVEQEPFRAPWEWTTYSREERAW